MLSVAYANDIQLRSDVVNERLIPVIQVNGKPVLRIQDKGPKGVFESNFERAERIYLNLIELEERPADWSYSRAAH